MSEGDTIHRAARRMRERCGTAVQRRRQGEGAPTTCWCPACQR